MLLALSGTDPECHFVGTGWTASVSRRLPATRLSHNHRHLVARDRGSYRVLQRPILGDTDWPNTEDATSSGFATRSTNTVE